LGHRQNSQSETSNPKSFFDVVIIGGGLSGLAAAVKLALHGARIALFEQSPKLGGRCYSYVDETTGDVVDNGQHVLVGAYHNTLEFLRLIGTRNLLSHQERLRLPLHHPTKGFAAFEVSSLPRPFHLSAGMLKLKLLSLRDRRNLLNVGFTLVSWNDALEKKLSCLTVEQWLDSLTQSEEAKKALWYPVAISVMNELPHRASALLFARSLKSTFLGRKSDSAILIPRVGQTELYVCEAEKLLLSKNAKIFTNAEVEEIEIQRSAATGVRLKNGVRVQANRVIGCVPHYSLGNLLPAKIRQETPFCTLSKFQSSAIISIHLWLDIDCMKEDYVGLIGRRLQWIFNRKRILGKEGNAGGYISSVMSGAHEFVGMTKNELVAISLEDLQGVYPELRRARLIHSVVIKEKRATFSPTNDIDPYRPSTETPIRNLLLAGDWTNTGLPGTIEGAVLSGFKAADCVIGTV